MAKKQLTIEEKLQAALVPVEEQPYKVPENWCWVKLGTVITASKEKQDAFDSETKYVGLEHIEKDTGNISFALADEVKSTKSVFKCGDILYGKLRPYLNKHGIVDFNGVCSTDILVFNAIKGDNRLYDFYFSLPHFIEYAVSNSKGINLPRVSEKVILEIPFPMPPQGEQFRIVARIESLFAKLDEAKEKIQEVLDGADLRRDAILHQAFTGKLTAKWRKETGVSVDSWLNVKTQDVCEKIVCGKTPKEFISLEGEVPFLKVFNIVNNKVDFAGNKQYIPKEISDKKLKSSILKPNDIIMNIVGPPLRKIAIIPNDYGEWNMNQAIVRFRPKDVLNYQYLYYALLYPKTLDEVIKKTRGVVGQANISITQSRNLMIPLPTLPEQQEIVRLLDNLLSREQSMVTACEEALTTIDTLKKSILARTFRGELGTNDPAEPSAQGLLQEILEA